MGVFTVLVSLSLLVNLIDRLNFTVDTLTSMFGKSKTIKDYAQSKGLFKFLLVQNFILLGPSKSGKSSLSNFLLNGLYADEAQPEKTTELQKIGKPTVVTVGEQKITIAKYVDSPGEHNYKEQIENIRSNNARTAVIWCSHEDFQTDDAKSGLNWFREFLDHLNDYLLDDTVETDLTSIVVVLNKQDLVSDEDNRKNHDIALKTISEVLGKSIGNNVSRISVSSCTLLKREGGEEALEEVMRLLNKGIKSKKPLRKS